MDSGVALFVLIAVLGGLGSTAADFNRLKRRRAKDKAAGVKGSIKHSQYSGARKKNARYQPSFGVSNRVDKHEPAIIYLIRHPESRALKVGITSLGAKTQRIRQHQRNGWQQVAIWTTESLLVAREIEKTIVRWWRDDLGLGPAVLTGSRDGISETVSASRISPDECLTKIESLISAKGQLVKREVSLDALVTGELVVTRGHIMRIDRTRVTHRRYGSGREHGETWWKVELKSHNAYLTLEFAPRRDISIRQLPLRTLLEVEGRVESVAGQKRMTNPKWRVLENESLDAND